MLLSAASACLALMSVGDADKQTLSAVEQRAWAKVRPSVVTMMHSGIARGIGVCVDSKGSFLVHRSAVPFPNLFAKLSSGIQIQVKLVASDDTTQLSLVQAVNPLPTSVAPIKIGSEPEKAGGSLLAVLVTGPIRATFVNGERYGIVKPSLRLVPLNELQFEAHSAQIGGGLVFTVDGSLMGILDATLGLGEPNQNQVSKSADSTLGGGFGGAALAAPPGASRAALPRPRPSVQFGPAPQTVAYTISSSVLHRVVSGLSSPSRKVLHPAIGVQCRNFEPLGAQITSVVVGSPAEKAGLRVGDVILAIGGALINNQLDVPRITMRLRIGTEVEVRYRRDDEERSVSVGVGAA